MAKTAPISIRLPEALNDQVAEVAAALDRPKSWVVEQAVRDYVATQQWQLAAIDEGIRAADAGELASHDDVVEWIRSWGSADELPPPKCG
jgi:predicted transcriptional regulator